MNNGVPNTTQATTTSIGGLPYNNIPYLPYPTYPSGISETHTKHVHIDLGLIYCKDVTIIKGNQKITMTPEELAIKLGLEW